MFFVMLSLLKSGSFCLFVFMCVGGGFDLFQQLARLFTCLKAEIFLTCLSHYVRDYEEIYT